MMFIVDRVPIGTSAAVSATERGGIHIQREIFMQNTPARINIFALASILMISIAGCSGSETSASGTGGSPTGGSGIQSSGGKPSTGGMTSSGGF